MNSLPILFNKLSIDSRKKDINIWQESLSKDIENLLNESARSKQLEFSDYISYAKFSVINFGLPSLSKRMPINIDAITLAEHITEILIVFEPRIDPDSIRVVPIVDGDDLNVLSMLFDIYAKSYLNNQEIILNIKISLDCSCGAVRVL